MMRQGPPPHRCVPAGLAFALVLRCRRGHGACQPVVAGSPSSVAPAGPLFAALGDHREPSAAGGNYFGAGPQWEDFSSPAIGDLTGKGEVAAVMGMVDGVVIAVRASDGSVLWRRDLGPHLDRGVAGHRQPVRIHA